MRSTWFLLSLAFATYTTEALAGPIGDLYLTGCNTSPNCAGTGIMYRIHGTQVTSWAAENHASAETAIAINESTIKTVGSHSSFSITADARGYAYDFGGTPTGQFYTYNMFNNGLTMYDGTSDGTYNYGMNLEYSELWRFGRDWGNGTKMWSTPISYGYGIWGGVAYDRTASNQIWLATFNPGTLYDTTQDPPAAHGNVQKRQLDTGAYLGSFAVSFSIGGLALDDDGSLWMADNTIKGWIRHYTSAGDEIVADALQFCSDCSSLRIYSGEIASAADIAAWMPQGGQLPEPATWWLTLPAAALLYRRRK